MEAETGSKLLVAECVSICHHCPALAACRDWANGQRNLIGVVAGKLRGTVRVDDDETSRTTEVNEP